MIWKFRKLLSQIIRRLSCIFKENHVCIEEDNPSYKVIMVEEKLDGIGNLVDLPRLMFIDEECGNLKVVVDGGELTRNNNRKKWSELLQVYVYRKMLQTRWGKHDFSCGYIVFE